MNKKEKVDLILASLFNDPTVHPRQGMLSDIGKQCGCTREYVRQRMVFLGFGAMRSYVVRPHCEWCGKELKGSVGMRKFCNRECRMAYSIINYHYMYICEECGAVKTIHRNQVNNSRFVGLRFCSKLCQGRHLGRTEGFGKHPERQCYFKGKVGSLTPTH